MRLEEPLEQGFFQRSALEVARDLLGCTLLCDGVGGVIVETEGYREDDPACHAYGGVTERNKVLFGPPGGVYVYLSYGIHRLLNFVAEAEGQPAAVLIRALEPSQGVEKMMRRRKTRSKVELCSGPGKLSKALGISLKDSGSNLFNGRLQVLARSEVRRDSRVVSGPRIGINKATDRPWRFCAADSRYVSRPCDGGQG